MTTDDDIIDKADLWNAENNKTQRKLADQKHERLLRIGRFLQWAAITVAFGSLIFGGGRYGCTSCSASCKADEIQKAADAKQLREDHRTLKALYDAAWANCIGRLGIENCNLVGERAVWECGSGNRHVLACRTETMASRLELLNTVGE